MKYRAVVAFIHGLNDRYYADLYEIAKIQLRHYGLTNLNISGGIWNTYSNPELHSSRRDGENSGRMATVIWIN